MRSKLLLPLLVLALTGIAVSCSSGSGLPLPTAQATQAPTSAAAPAAAAAATASPKAIVQASIVSITEPALRGKEIVVRATAAPGAACSLSVRLSVGVAAKAEGLGDQTAGADGSVSWSFVLPDQTPGGTTTAKLTCGQTTQEREFRLVTS